VVSATGQGQLTSVAQIAAGSSITCAVLTSGAARCWGENDAGNLGTGDYDDHASPTAVVGITNATQVAVRTGHACAVLSNGQIKCWGSNLYGQLGNTSVGNLTSTPVVVTGINNAVAVGVGIYSTCALLSNGTVKCWGYNADGELGDGTYTSSDTPVTVAGVQGATGLAVGDQHACVRLQSGEGRCWGSNSYEQLTQPDGVGNLPTPGQLNF
jgi:alpha-tubulin suppressor-like RCC1 family protein